MISSPLRWAGGKSRARKYILPLLPPHDTYLEPFAGAAWILFGKKPARREILNDINPELVAFYEVIRDQPQAFLESFTFELVSRAEFERLAALDPNTLSPVQRAHRFYYLIMAGYGGESGYPRFSTAIHDAGHGNRLIGALKTLPDKILPASQRLQNVTLANTDWQTQFDAVDRPETLVYLDPPYLGNPMNYTHNMTSWTEHQAMATRLNTTRCKWLLSSYNLPALRSLYPNASIQAVSWASGQDSSQERHSKTENTELLIANFPIAEPVQHTLF